MIFSPLSENYALTHSAVRNCAIFYCYSFSLMTRDVSWSNSSFWLMSKHKYAASGKSGSKKPEKDSRNCLITCLNGVHMYYIHGNYLCNGVNISWNKRCWHWQVTHSNVTLRHILLHLAAWLTHKCENVPVFENHQIAHLSACLCMYRASTSYGVWSTLALQGQYSLMVLVSVSIYNQHIKHIFLDNCQKFLSIFLRENKRREKEKLMGWKYRAESC